MVGIYFFLLGPISHWHNPATHLIIHLTIACNAQLRWSIGVCLLSPLFSTDTESAPYLYLAVVYYWRMTPNYLRSAWISGCRWGAFATWFLFCSSSLWHCPLLPFPLLLSLTTILYPFPPTRLSGCTTSRDHSAMSWGTWGPLLMVTNDWLCREEKREWESTAEGRTTGPAVGQCFSSAQTEKLRDTATWNVKCYQISSTSKWWRWGNSLTF